MKKWTGKEITKLRGQLGLSMMEFAASLGISLASLYRWEASQDNNLGAIRYVLEAISTMANKVKDDEMKATALGMRVREGLYNLVLRGLK